jgi:hypothetical protein
LYTYGAFYLGGESNTTITGKTVSYRSRESFNVNICGMQIPLVKKFTV